MLRKRLEIWQTSAEFFATEAKHPAKKCRPIGNATEGVPYSAVGAGRAGYVAEAASIAIAGAGGPMNEKA